MAKVFVSYARADGGTTAVRLAERLADAGHVPWLDTQAIVGGAVWSLEIEQAIDQADTFLALLSPGYYLSRICRAEQGRASDQQKPIVPLLVARGTNRTLFVQNLQWIDFVDATKFDTSFAELLEVLAGRRILSGPPRPRPASMIAVPDVAHFVPRPRELAELRNAILSDLGSEEVALAAIRGMGGVGKTVLAAAVCRDPVIADAFPDGIVWVTIGKEASLREKLIEVGKRLGESDAQYDSVEAAREGLARALGERSVLLVLDDVWTSEHVLAFRLSTPRSRVLFTTRITTLAQSTGATPVTLGPMSPEEAVRLLETASGRTDAGFAAVAERVGGLPLALKLAGARIADGMTASAWLERFTEVSRIRSHKGATGRDESLVASIELSTSDLETGDQHRLHLLGLFREDVPVPFTAAARLWETASEDAEETIDELARLALIGVDRERRALTLHDVIRLYAREQLGDVVQWNRHLLRKWNPDGKPWSSMADDGYAHANLVYHFQQQGEPEQVHELLREATEEGRNAWYIARRNAGDVAGYVSDLETAWQLAAADAPSPVPGSTGLAGEIFCALCRSSVQSTSLEIPPELVLALVAHGVWTHARARLLVDQTVSVADQVHILFGIATTVTGEEQRALLRMAAERARRIPDAKTAEDLRSQALIALCHAGHSADVVDAMKDGGPGQRRADAVAVAPHIDGIHHGFLLTLAGTLDEWGESEVVFRLLPHAQGPFRAELAERAVELAERVKGGRRGGELYSAVVAALAGTPRATELLPNAIKAIEQMPQGQDAAIERAAEAIVRAGFADAATGIFIAGAEEQARAMGALARNLSGDQRLRVVRDLVTYARSVTWDSSAPRGVAMLADVAPELADELIDEACRLAATASLYKEEFLRLLAMLPDRALPRVVPALNKVEHEYHRPGLLAEILLRDDSGEVIAQAAAVAESMAKGRAKGEMYAAIAHRVPPAERRLWVARAFTSVDASPRRDRTHVAIAVLPAIDDDSRTSTVDEIFSAVREEEYDPAVIELLTALSAHGGPLELRRIYRFAATMPNVEVRRAVLAGAAPHLTGEDLREILDQLGAIGDWRRPAAFGTFAQLHVLGDLEPETADAAAHGWSGIPDAMLVWMVDDMAHGATTIDAEAEALRLLALELTRRGRIDDAVRIARILRSDPDTRQLVGGVTGVLPAPRVDEILADEKDARENARAFLHAPLLPHVTEETRRQVVAELLEIARTVPAGERPVHAAILMPLVDAKTRRDLLRRHTFDPVALHDRLGRYGPLVALLPYLELDEVEAAASQAKKHEDRGKGARAFFILSSRIPKRLDDALGHTIYLPKLERARFLAVHAGLFAAADDRAKIHRQAMTLARNVGDESTAEVMIECLVDQVQPAEIAEALRLTMESPFRRQLLAALVPRLVTLDAASLRAALHDALVIASRHQRVDLVEDLRALRFAMWRAAGPVALRQSAEHVEQVSGWWP